ncbi:hypothetical protein B0A48_00162 [Cryoendolithus antarcticus]|uniref:Uncharacterized protein n=1 Tax=Cryoendolithus antarcticus TaxID=1507870 RepID=A0A1V8TTU2_9PEZI|nr:hypothetical protein B0A48_00162 [Cryoendolithus antarcticus]
MAYNIPPPPRDHGMGGHNVDVFPVDDRFDSYGDFGTGRHNDIDGLEAVLGDTHIGGGGNNKKNKKGVSYLDDDFKDKKTTSTSTKPVEIRHEGFVLTKITPPNGEKPVWSKVGSRPIPLDDVRLEAMGRKHLQKSGVTAGTYFTKELSTEQQGIVDRLINQKTNRERETNVEWVLFDVAKIDERVKVNFFQDNIVTTKLRLIIRRQAVKSSNPKKPNTSTSYDYGEIIDLSVPLNANLGKKDGKKDNVNKKKQSDLDDDLLASIMYDTPPAKSNKKKNNNHQHQFQDDLYGTDPFSGHGNQHNNRQDNFAHHGDAFGGQNFNQQPYAQQPLQGDPFAHVPGAIPVDDYARHHNVPPAVPMPPPLNPFQPEVGAQAQYDAYGANAYEPYGPARITTRPRSQSRLRQEELDREDERRRSRSRRRREDARDRRLSKDLRKVRNDLAEVKDKVEGWNAGSGSSEGSGFRDDIWTPPRSPRYSSPATSPDRNGRRPAGSLHRRQSGDKGYRRDQKYYKDRRGHHYEVTPGGGYRDDRDRGRRLSDYSPQQRPRLIHAATHDDYPAQPRYTPARRLTDYAEGIYEADFGRGDRGVDYLRAEPKRASRAFEYEGPGRRNSMYGREYYR